MPSIVLQSQYLGLPADTTANRPGSPSAGWMRYNTTRNLVEYYDTTQTQWIGIGAFTATGGTVTTSGGYTIHTFTGNDIFQVISGTKGVELMVVAGGGAGGAQRGGGGGAGGLIYNSSFSVSTGSYSITVGGGGTCPGDTTGAGPATNGANSTFANLTAVGGGAGGNDGTYNTSGLDGGSGGGAAVYSGNAIGNGTAGQGNPGGLWNVAGPYYYSGGGGGAGATGQSGSDSKGGDGGAGLTYSVSGSSVAYAGGGGGGSYRTGANNAAGGTGGGGAAALNSGTAGVSGTTNRGGGGGGGWNGDAGSIRGGNGGSGIVIIRYLTS
jgi:hypothetical protein